jgi:hypothetical protein
MGLRRVDALLEWHAIELEPHVLGDRKEQVDKELIPACGPNSECGGVYGMYPPCCRRARGPCASSWN